MKGAVNVGKRGSTITIRKRVIGKKEHITTFLGTRKNPQLRKFVLRMRRIRSYIRLLRFF